MLVLCGLAAWGLAIAGVCVFFRGATRKNTPSLRRSA